MAPTEAANPGPISSTLAAEVFARLAQDPKPDPEREALVLAALEGPETLASYLDDGAEPPKPKPAPTTDGPAREPLGAYLESITVEGFRGIGPRKTLELPPGPGLTLVVGRNGSGKSSFAEALELLLTGDTYRWKSRAKVWQQGWRNLHHQTAAIEAAFLVEGEKGATKVRAAWKDGADLADAETHAQIHGKPRMDPAELGWDQALATYRPFLSYNELGSMLDEGPSKLYDALSAILGLEELTEAQTTLADARKAREKAHKDASQQRDAHLTKLRALDDARARALVAALDSKTWGLDEADKVLTDAATGAGQEDDVQALRQLATQESPTADAVATLARDMRDAHARQKAAANTLAAKSKELAAILDHALRFHKEHGDGDCPVCGKKAALDTTWHEEKAQEAERLKEAATQATLAQQAADAARKRLEALPSPKPDALAKASPLGIDTENVRKALDAWRQGQTSTTDLDALARHIEETAGPLEAAVQEVREKAQAELQRREDKWRPIARPLSDWLAEARQAQRGAQATKPLKPRGG